MPLRLYRPGAREGRGTMYRQWMVLTWCKGRKGLIVEVGARLCLEEVEEDQAAKVQCLTPDLVDSCQHQRKKNYVGSEN
eukprot:1139250-Pelagomonas_calceolata.AAC.11